MNHSPAPQESGIRVDNTLSLSLHRKTHPRRRWLLMLLTLAGTAGSIFTFLSMFAPEVHTLPLLLLMAALAVFFGWHSEHPTGAHWTILVFFGIYLALLWHVREQFASGVLYLMNVMYKTIYMTEWEYFILPEDFDIKRDMSLFVAVFSVPISWLLSNSVMRYHSFLLSFLVTFPFVEIGFFFGVVPSHIPMAVLLGFWAAMIAVYHAGGGAFNAKGRSGFTRKRNRFSPVPSMRLLVTEAAGLWMLVLCFVLFWTAEFVLERCHYERPDRVKEMRTDFQYYAANIDWSDLSTVFPFFYGGKPQEERVNLGRDEKRTYQNIPVTTVSFSELPESAVYLRFSGYGTYDRNRWDILTDEMYENVPVFETMEALSYYPPAFLGQSVLSVAYLEQMSVTMQNPDDILSRCVPYGYSNERAVGYRFDNIGETWNLTYSVANTDYTTLLQSMDYLPETAEDFLTICTPSYRELLAETVSAADDQTVWSSYQLTALPYYADTVLLGKSGYNDFAKSVYLQVPDMQSMDFIRRQYESLWEDYDPENAAPAETMALLEAIRDRICAGVTYTLAPGKTPPGRDFMAYFLLENRKGYCQHYATAGTILARMAGIPARYCEGYIVKQEELQKSHGQYTTELLDSAAHAWSEVYIEGFGWVPFEFTYSYFDRPEPVTEPVTEPPTQPPTTETTTTMPTRPTTEPDTTAPAPPVPEGQTESHLGLMLAILAGLLLTLAVIGGFVAVRNMALQKRAAQLTQEDTDAAAEAAWRFLLELLQASGADVSAATAGALGQEMLRVCSGILDEEMIHALLETATLLRYSPHSLSREQTELLCRAASALSHALYQNSGPLARFRYKWIRHYL